MKDEKPKSGAAPTGSVTAEKPKCKRGRKPRGFDYNTARMLERGGDVTPPLKKPFSRWPKASIAAPAYEAVKAIREMIKLAGPENRSSVLATNFRVLEALFDNKLARRLLEIAVAAETNEGAE